jgi:lipopolysaccharide/colanic/teichoic acid biosynthesis glycosyltransferase
MIEPEKQMHKITWRDRVRRSCDVIVALLAGTLSLPIMLLVGIQVAIWLGRPVFFAQTRAGRDCRPFSIIKFRSMPDLRDENGQLLSDEERMTRFGRLLRRSRLDELPEFWNILVGDMSLIGPRPVLFETIASLGERGRLRCCVRPGLTGWAQISGNAVLNDVDKLDLDLWYIENRTIWLDLKIVFMTLLVLLFGDKVNQRRLATARAQRRESLGWKRFR